MKNIDVYALHDFLFKARHIEDLFVTSQVDSQASEDDVEDSQAHQEKPDAVLVGLVERSLGLNHAPQPEVGGGLSSLLWVLVDATHALITHVEDQADDLWCLSEQGSSLDSGVLIKLEGSLDISEVVVLEL